MSCAYTHVEYNEILHLHNPAYLDVKVKAWWEALYAAWGSWDIQQCIGWLKQCWSNLHIFNNLFLANKHLCFGLWVPFYKYCSKSEAATKATYDGHVSSMHKCGEKIYQLLYMWYNRCTMMSRDVTIHSANDAIRYMKLGSWQDKNMKHSDKTNSEKVSFYNFSLPFVILHLFIETIDASSFLTASNTLCCLWREYKFILY